MAESAVLLDLHGVRQAYHKREAEDLLVLDDVALTLCEGEVVGLLGRSGSGKSSLLRIIAGLNRPTAGTVRWQGQPLDGPPDGVSMVFQTFALFPWLTVLENVEIGLEALRVPAAERRRRSLEAIDLIGLDGFESAYPKELSGGMRQRVGLARALVVHPQLLLMDEPFSALDVLTAETLRTDLIDLWSEGRLPMKSILLVTHNIEEAVLMCDRILIFSSNPGRVATELRVDLPHPRNRTAPDFRHLVDDIYARMTQRPVPAAQPVRADYLTGSGLDMLLPDVSTNSLAGLLEAVAAPPHDGHADLPILADDLRLHVDELFPITEVGQLLRFIEISDGHILLTPAGHHFVEAAVDGRKRLFADHLLRHVPLAALIRKVLDERPTHRVTLSRFADELEDYMSEDMAGETLRAVIAWGRYSELFAYDEQSRRFSLENPA